MKIGIHYNDRRTQSTPWLDAFAEGARRHGEHVVCGTSKPLDVDVAVTWSAKKYRINEAMAAREKDVLIVEHGYFGDRTKKFCSCGFNGLNGRADFLMPISKPAGRWEKHKVEVKPWRQTDGDYVLILGQVDGDASMKAFRPGWYERIATEAKAVFGLPVVFRPHPLARKTSGGSALKVLGGTLEDALAGAHCAITWNSNSGVDAILAGIPTFVFDEGSMAWPVAGHRLKTDLFRPDRTLWLRHLAYCQWTIKELESGETWDFLKGAKYEAKSCHAACV